MLQEPSRKEIWKMFDAISGTYDTVNRVISGGMDVRWRKKMAHLLPSGESLQLLDCATGTGDQLFALMEHAKNIQQAIGVDLSKEMLKIAESKSQKKPYHLQVRWQHASATTLPFSDQTFDCLTISFGIRNVENLQETLAEFYRVLKVGGRLLILETSMPENAFVKKFHLFYLRHILPKLGGWISKKPEAYAYLNQTTETFPCGQTFCNLLESTGFKHVSAHPLTLGAATIYAADRPA
jgi:demethylmenaquinone methyltransferase/2-methoxy-6-polyprenyl-1,4-benzoquinol methylase